MVKIINKKVFDYAGYKQALSTLKDYKNYLLKDGWVLDKENSSRGHYLFFKNEIKRELILQHLDKWMSESPDGYAVYMRE